MVNFKLVEGERLATVKINFSLYLEKKVKGRAGLIFPLQRLSC